MDEAINKRRMFQITGFSEEVPEVDCVYRIIGHEICPTTGRKHWHMFIYFKNPRSIEATTKRFRPHHVETCHGTIDQNIDYVKKDGDYEEFGVRPRQGRRVDIEDLKEMKKMRDIVEATPDPRNIRMMEKYLTYHEDRRNWKTEVYWYHGSTGSGKTRS